MAEASHCISEYESASYCRFAPYHLRASSRSSGSLVFRFFFLLDFLLVVPNIECNFGRNGLTPARQSDIRSRGQLSKFHLSAILAAPASFRCAFPQPAGCDGSEELRSESSRVHVSAANTYAYFIPVEQISTRPLLGNF
jgi:hypothetical protein